MLAGPPATRRDVMPKRAAEGIELLADATRRQIVALIASRIRHPSDIAQALGLSRPAVSRQLRLLVVAGLLRWRWSTIDRRSRVYAIEPAMQEPILAWLAGVDLRHARPPVRIWWSPPMRVHRRRRDARELTVDRGDFV
jgi:DNA-binding transcriptional ArsR family regulator